MYNRSGYQGRSGIGFSSQGQQSQQYGQQQSQSYGQRQNQSGYQQNQPQGYYQSPGQGQDRSQGGFQQNQNQYGGQGYQSNPSGLSNVSQMYQRRTAEEGANNDFNPNPNAITGSNPLFEQINEQKLEQAQHTLTLQDLSCKVCISRLPPGTTDELVQSLLKSCGEVVSWKRFQDANKQPKDGGLAEFKDIKGVFSCYKFINNLELQEGKFVLVKANQKTQTYFNNVIDLKREEYLDFLNEQKQGDEQPDDVKPEGAPETPAEGEQKDKIPTVEQLKEQEEQCNAIVNGLQTYEIEMLLNGHASYQQIKETLIQILEPVQAEEEANISQNSPENKERQSLPGQDSSQTKKEENSKKRNYEETIDPLLKYKEHERERHRERKIKQLQSDKQMKLKRLLNNQYHFEKDLVRDHQRELGRIEKLERIKQEMIRDDKAYDSAEDERKQRKYSKDYQRYAEKRKRIRERERQDDELDRVREQKEVEELENRKIEQLKRREERRKTKEVEKERLKLKRFIEMQQEIEEKQRIEQQKAAETTQVAESESQAQTQKDKKVSVQAQSSAQILKVKELYLKMPKKREDIFAYQLNWQRIFDQDIIENICQPWISKKIKEYMGAEEPMMINIVIKLLKQKCSEKQLLNKIQHILDEASEEFVEKLWRVLVFEDMKIEEGLYKM